MATKTKRVSKIHTWKPKAKEVLIDRDGKLFVCHFDKVFGIDKLSQYNRFLIGKDSYINQLDTITSYANFFVNNYDQDQELVTAYLKIKFALDKKRQFNEESMGAYIDFIYAVMFTPTMVEKICTMVEENYLDDIESTDETDAPRKYVKTDKKHLESLEFTNQHIKILLRISFGMKIMSPALFHYTQINHIKIEKESDIIYRFYKPLFDLFGYGETYDIFDKFNVLIKEDVPIEEFGEMKSIIPFREEGSGKDIKYWFTDEDGEEKYFTRTKVDMYNKLYVYVTCFGVQYLVTDISKTHLIAGTSR